MSLFMSHISLHSSLESNERVEIICVSLQSNFSEIGTDESLRQEHWRRYQGKGSYGYEGHGDKIIEFLYLLCRSPQNKMEAEA